VSCISLLVTPKDKSSGDFKWWVSSCCVIVCVLNGLYMDVGTRVRNLGQRSLVESSIGHDYSRVLSRWNGGSG
jgi:hypothetical protein